MAAAPAFRLRPAGTARSTRPASTTPRARSPRRATGRRRLRRTEPPCRALAAAAPADLADLGLDEGGHLLVDRASAASRRPAADGDRRASGAGASTWAPGAVSTGTGVTGRRARTAAAGGSPAAGAGRREGQRAATGAGRARSGPGRRPGPPGARADAAWGLAARGALVEAGGPPIGAHWSEREHVWADIAPSCTPPRRRRSGTRRPPSTGPRRSTRSRLRSSGPSSRS